MDYLWAPWRIEYIKHAKDEGCILCDKPAAGDDAANLILYHGAHNFIILNAYPYNPGHLMVAPDRHVATLDGLSDVERNELFELVSRSVVILRKVFCCDGFNIGLNLGKIAGAGVDKHIHTHIVPRWAGDTNFMPVIADTRVINEAVAETYARLKPVFSAL